MHIHNVQSNMDINFLAFTFLHFYWHNTREEHDNCKVLFRIINKPEILLRKIEGLFFNSKQNRAIIMFYSSVANKNS